MLRVEGVRLEGDQVTSMPWDAQGEAQAALRTIVADPRYGPPAGAAAGVTGAAGAGVRHRAALGG
jgi:hypothetical protein